MTEPYDDLTQYTALKKLNIYLRSANTAAAQQTLAGHENLPSDDPRTLQRLAGMTRASVMAFCGRRRNRVIVVKYPKQTQQLASVC